VAMQRPPDWWLPMTWPPLASSKDQGRWKYSWFHKT